MPGFSLPRVAAAIQAEDAGTVVQVIDVDGTPATYGADKRPVTVTVTGILSKRYRDAEAAHLEARRARLLAGEQDDGADREVVLPAACVTAWDGFFVDEAETEPWPCTRANVEAALRAAEWLRNQLWVAMSSHALFTNGPRGT